MNIIQTIDEIIELYDLLMGEHLRNNKIPLYTIQYYQLVNGLMGYAYEEQCRLNLPEEDLELFENKLIGINQEDVRTILEKNIDRFPIFSIWYLMKVKAIHFTMSVTDNWQYVYPYIVSWEV